MTETSSSIYRFETQYGLRGTVRLYPAQGPWGKIFKAESDGGRRIFSEPIEGYLGQNSYLDRDKTYSEEDQIKDALHANSVGTEEPWVVRELIRPRLEEGQFHPHIYRQLNGPKGEAVYGREYTDNVVAYTNLAHRLTALFRIVEPDPVNDQTFGHGIRELLILACTEVEVLCRQVLKANHYTTKVKARLGTNDYVKIKDALELESWSVGLKDYPDYPVIKPFLGWMPGSPTQSLKFYSDYNAVKHSRDEGFSLATLQNAIRATAAVYVLLASQFGYKLDLFEWGANPSLFVFQDTPTYSLEDTYVPPLDGSWTPVDYTF